MTTPLGQIVRSFFEDHLKVQKGLRPGTIRSYRDALRLFLSFISRRVRRPITRLTLEDLSFERTLEFLKHLEDVRRNHIRTRNQRLAALRAFFEYVGARVPELLETCERVVAIPVKRAPPPETCFLDQDEVSALIRSVRRSGRNGVRDRALLLFLYNTGARVQEVADLRVEHLDLSSQPRVQLHGKGDKWRACPLWEETANQLRALVADSNPDHSVFSSRAGVPLTRSGIYKIVRRHSEHLDRSGDRPRRISPHVFRHTAAVHLLESGVEVNVIRAWLGHVSLETTNRYAEITLRTKEEALRTCEPAWENSEGRRPRSAWKNDESLLKWLDSL